MSAYVCYVCEPTRMTTAITLDTVFPTGPESGLFMSDAARFSFSVRTYKVHCSRILLASRMPIRPLINPDISSPYHCFRENRCEHHVITNYPILALCYQQYQHDGCACFSRGSSFMFCTINVSTIL